MNTGITKENNFEIRLFDYKNKEHVEDIGFMHRAVLPESNVPGLGNLFMKKFYYKVLPEKKLIRCYLFYFENKLAGFLVANTRPFSLIKEGIKNHYVFVASILLWSLISNPFRIRFFLSQLKYKVDPLLKKYEEEKDTFEILSIGVLEEYRYVRPDNEKKISQLLADHAIDHFRKSGYKKITGQILKSNEAVLKFYQKYNVKYFDSTVRDNGVIMEIQI